MSDKSESNEESPSDNSQKENKEKEEDENQLIEEINENYKYMNQSINLLLII